VFRFGSLYCVSRTFLNADTQSYGGKIVFSGVANAMALLLLLWMYFYSLEHEGEEGKIQSAIAALLSVAASGSSGEDAADSGAEIPILMNEAQSEF
jgi:hypothetical protein